MFAGEPVEVICEAGLVELVYKGVVIATHAQRRRADDPAPTTAASRPGRTRAASQSVTRVPVLDINSDLDEEAAAKAASPTTGMASSSRCSDGKDNDGDGAVDYPQDQGCSSAADNMESSDQPAAEVEAVETTDPPPAGPAPGAQTVDPIQVAPPEPAQPASSQLSCSSFSSQVVINGQVTERYAQTCGGNGALRVPLGSAHLSSS